MARMIILYGTTEGQTEKIAEHIAAVLNAHGQTTTLVNSEDLSKDFPLTDYDVAIVGASMHSGGYQHSVHDFVKQHQAQLAEMPSAFFSVSMTAAAPTAKERSQLDTHLARFFTETGWHPKQVVSFAGALAYTQYHGPKRWVMRRIARAMHAPTDPSRDYEYTDWEAVTRFAESLLPVAVATQS